MSLNDMNLGVAKGADVYDGLANPTSHSNTSNPRTTNFVEDPTTEELGAGAGPGFQGHIQAAKNFKNTAGVIEGRPGVIESTHIEPLKEDTALRDQWEDAGVSSTERGPSNSGMIKVATDLGNATSNMLTGAVKMAYGSVAGNEEAFKAGKEAVYGKGA